MRHPRADDDSDYGWSMPFGESIYTHAPEPPSMYTGAVSTAGGTPKRKRRVRRIGFRPPTGPK